MKIWTGRILLSFAIFTLGFGLGKEAGLRRSAVSGDATALSTSAVADQVLVYYLHTTAVEIGATHC